MICLRSSADKRGEYVACLVDLTPEERFLVVEGSAHVDVLRALAWKHEGNAFEHGRTTAAPWSW